MGLSWLMNDFICKELYAPYIIDKYSDYYDSLQKKYNLVLKQAEKANADLESIAIIKKYSKKILESMRAYYNADLSKSCTIIKQYSYGNTSLILVLPYIKAEYRDNEQNYLGYYDEVEVCSESSDSHYKSAIQVRNKCMVDRSDLIVCCIQRKSGGAYKTVQYALKQGKQVKNLSDNEL